MTELIARLNEQRVHAVRHTFEPNQPLTELLDDFVGPNKKAPFVLNSTKQVYVESLPYSRGNYRREDEYVHDIIEKFERMQFTMAKVAFRGLFKDQLTAQVPGALPDKYRVSFLPQETELFENFVNTLDVYPKVPMPGLIVPSASKHYLTLDLPGTVVGNFPDRDEAEASFRETIQDGAKRRLFAAAVSRVVGIETTRPSRPLSQNQ